MRIVITLEGDTIELETHGQGGTVTSSLAIPASNTEYPKSIKDRYNAAIDGVESLVLAHACAGVDVRSKEYVGGLKVAIESITNNLL